MDTTQAKQALESKPATVAQLIRADLKAAFPGIKFSVRSPHYGTVNVGWAMGPTAGAVDAVLAKYEAGHFDGMTDSYVYNKERANHPTANYVFTSRDTSAVDEQVCRDICRQYGVEYAGRSTLLSTNGGNHYVSDQAYRQLRQTDLTNGYQGQVVS